MKMKVWSLMAIAIVALALAVSGCIDLQSIIGGILPGGGNATTPAATEVTSSEPGENPTGEPTTGVVTGGGKEPKSVPDMYDFSKFSSLNTKLDMGAGPADVTTVFSEEAFNGVPAHRIMATSVVNGIEVVEDCYYDNTGKFIGGYIDGDEVSAADMGEHYKDHAWVIFGQSFKLTKTGSEAVTAGGKTYQCTKFTTVRNGVPFTFWWSPEAPAPVKVVSQSGSSTMTETLEGWS